jgi:pimeloyl-ACP methyl ester carboxylesterase
LLGALQPDAAGFVYVDRSQFHAVFCADLSEDEALVMAATQKPVHGSTFGAPTGPVAWHDVPVFYQISENDHAVSPDLERFLADRMKATTLSLPSSHVAMLSHPKEIAEFIVKAASA